MLGALNSLFTPHPVSGAPSPSASAKQGLLGKLVSGGTTGAGANASGEDQLQPGGDR